MIAEVARRLTRLCEVLPSVYDTRPGDSVLGTVLLRVARELADIDEAQRRVLHDHWLPLASGSAATDSGLPALDRLGALLGTPRLAAADPAGDAPVETAESYRARLAITGRALTGGLATPRALLSLALAAVGTEACPKLRTRLAKCRLAGDPWVVEATEARGMAPGMRRRCVACDKPGAPCPQEGQAALAEAYLVENPLSSRKRLTEAAYWQAFPIASQSLTTDRPAIRLRPLAGQALSNPAIQNQVTGEIVLFQGFVRPGETLVLLPAMTEAELWPFDGMDAEGHHPWTRGGRPGRAVIQGTAGERDVSSSIFFISGSCFDDLDTVLSGPAGDGPDPAELGTRFAVMAQAVRTPRLRPGTDFWRLLQFARTENVFWSGSDEAAPAGHATEEPPRLADALAVEGSRFALLDSTGHDTGVEQARLLFDSLKRAEEAASLAPAGSPVAEVDIEWLVRPPATVRLCLRRSAQVEIAQQRGAIDLLLHDLDLARPAGVRTLFEIRERPLPQEALTPAEGAIRMQTAGHWRDDAAPADAPVRIHVRAGLLAEQHQVGDSQPVWSGRFDGTAFDGSRLT